MIDFLEWYKRLEKEPIYVDRLNYDSKYKDKIRHYAHDYTTGISKDFEKINPNIQSIFQRGLSNGFR